jgi:hypothetical protein
MAGVWQQTENLAVFPKSESESKATSQKRSRESLDQVVQDSSNVRPLHSAMHLSGPLLQFKNRSNCPIIHPRPVSGRSRDLKLVGFCSLHDDDRQMT